MSPNPINELSIRIEAGSINTERVTGVGYYTESLIEAMSKLPHVAIDVFALGSEKATLSEHLRAATIHSLYVVPWLNQRIYRKLHQYFLAPPCDTTLPAVDVTIYPDFALWPTVNSKINGVVIHDLTFIKHPEFMRSRKLGPFSIPVTTWYLSAVVHKAVRRADFIITVSESIKSELISLLDVPADMIVVTPIPPRENFKQQATTHPTKNDLLQKYKIPTEDYILSVGTLEPRKNHIALLKAYLHLPQTVRASHSLVIAGGKGWGCDETLKAIHEAQQSGENIVLTGYFDTEDAHQLYSHATIFSSASHYEGFGMPLMESMYVGIPMVVSDIPVFKEVSGDAALYVDTSNSTVYAAALLSLLKDPGLREHLTSLGRKRLLGFSWQRNAQKVEDLCRVLLTQRTKH